MLGFEVPKKIRSVKLMLLLHLMFSAADATSFIWYQQKAPNGFKSATSATDSTETHGPLSPALLVDGSLKCTKRTPDDCSPARFLATTNSRENPDVAALSNDFSTCGHRSHIEFLKAHGSCP